MPTGMDHGRVSLGAGRRMSCALIPLLLLSSGCIQEMANQPRVDTYEESRVFSDGLNFRQQIPGTIARGQIWEQIPENTGRDDSGLLARMPVEVNAELLARGKERYEIFCRHCHGFTGTGDGMVVQRGFTIPPSYHIDRLNEAPDGHLFEVLTKGIGRMPGFRKRILPQDRWAIIAYVRALQLSNALPVDQLNEEERQKLSDASSQPAAVGDQPVSNQTESHDATR